MRVSVLVALLFTASPALAAPQSYDAVCPSTCTAPDGTTQPAGTALFRFGWDGVSAYVPHDAAGLTLTATPDAEQTVKLYQPPVAAPTTITAAAFFGRFSAAETVAVAQVQQASPQVDALIVQGLASNAIDLTSPSVKAFLDALVGAGALTAARETAILTP